MKYIFLAILLLNFSGCENSEDSDIRSTDKERAMRLKSSTKSFKEVETRLALIIGNGKYQEVTELKNPTNDSRSMKAKLETLGFDILYLENGTKKEMKDIIRRFQWRFDKNRNVVALFYYAGHGLESGGVNYLIPVNADIQENDEIEDEALSLNFILRKFDSSRNRLNIAILDACRDNPFRGLRTKKGGLASAQAKGTFIAYATALGDTAKDNRREGNGLFTKHILRNIDKKDVKLEDIFKAVAKEVSDESSGSQVPWRTSSIVDGDFYFVGDGKSGKNRVVVEEKIVFKDRVVEKEKIVEKVVIQKVVDNSKILELEKELAKLRAEKTKIVQKIVVSKKVEKIQKPQTFQKNGDSDWHLAINRWSEKYNLGLPKTKEGLKKVEMIYYSWKTLKMTYIPKEIGNMTNLRELWLSFNQIKEIPSSIGNLTNLEKLYLSGNKIKEIPQKLNRLKKLYTSYKGNNFIYKKSSETPVEFLKRSLNLR